MSGTILGLFVGDPFPFFPFAGYATYGIIFGMAFYLKIKPKYITICSLIASVIYLTLGIYFFSIWKYPTISEVYEMPNLQLIFIQMGIMLLICLIVYNIHYLPKDNKVRKIFTSYFLEDSG